MPHPNQKILAVDPGTRNLGFAVLSDAELVFYCVKSVKDKSTPRKILAEVATITTDMIVAYAPDCLAIEEPFVVQKSAAMLYMVANEIKSVARACGLPVYGYGPKTIRKSLCRSGSATKRDVARLIAERYPELRRYLNSQNKWTEAYYSHVYDAVAVGLMFQQELSSIGCMIPDDTDNNTQHNSES